MPKSKRSKVVTLTKTDKKTREWKESLFSKIRQGVDSYDYVYPTRLCRELIAGMDIRCPEYAEYVFEGC